MKTKGKKNEVRIIGSDVNAGLGDWLPIDTAPRNGKLIIVYEGKRVVVGNWPIGCAFGDWVKNKKDWDGFSLGIKPQGWMPSPKPPNMELTRLAEGQSGGAKRNES